MWGTFDKVHFKGNTLCTSFLGSKNETRVLVKPLGYLASPCGLDVVNVHFLAEICLSGIILSLE